MSDYCGQCRYDVKKRVGDDACPFNALYWDFLIRNQTKLGGNMRMAMVYRNVERMTPADREGGAGTGGGNQDGVRGGDGLMLEGSNHA